MPTIQELRRWLKGEDVQGLPKNKHQLEIKPNPFNHPAEKCNKCHGTGVLVYKPCRYCSGEGWKPKSKSVNQMLVELKNRHRVNKSKRAYYTISVDGKDAILGFGKYINHSVSDLASFEDGREYLRWMRTGEFDPELMEICEYQLRRNNG